MATFTNIASSIFVTSSGTSSAPGDWPLTFNMVLACFHRPPSVQFAVPCRAHNVVMCEQRKFSRRSLLLQFSAFPLSRILALEGGLCDDSETRVAADCIASTLRVHCAPFLMAIAPLSQSALLWRGHAQDYAGLTLLTPRSDLIDNETYGPQGAAFFRELDALLSGQSRETDFVPRPKLSHVGTGSSVVAAEWGIPLTVWPRGPIRYAFRKRGGLIYADGDSIDSAQVQRGSLTYTGLRSALQHGHEVLFQCYSFYIVPSQLLYQVVTKLKSHPP